MNNTIKKRSEFWQTIQYALSLNWLYTVLFVVFISLSIWVAISHSEYYTKYIDPIAGIMTLIVAVGIALVNYQKQWKDSLHKTLTVHFLYEGKYVLSCYYADLVSEGDIRNWAQQLGSQMTGGALLDFEPFFDLDKPKVIKLESNHKYTTHFKLRIFLKSDLNIRSREEIKAFDKDQLIQWYIVHSKDHRSDVKIQLSNQAASTNEIEPKYPLDVRQKNNQA